MFVEKEDMSDQDEIVEEAKRRIREAWQIPESTTLDTSDPRVHIVVRHLADGLRRDRDEANSPVELVETEDGMLPATIDLLPAPENVFDGDSTVARWTEEMLAADFNLAGDYLVDRVGAELRGFVGGPGTAAVICRFGDVVCVEIVVFYADGTREVWNNLPTSTGPAPPWCTWHKKPDANVETLLAMMRKERSRKERRQYSANRFDIDYEVCYSVDVHWKAMQFEAKRTRSPEEQVTEGRVWAFTREIRAACPSRTTKPDNVPSGKDILQLSPCDQIEVLEECFRLHDVIVAKTSYDSTFELRERLLRRKLPYTNTDIEFLAKELRNRGSEEGAIVAGILGAIERYAKTEVLSDQTREQLRKFRESRRCRGMPKAKARINSLIGIDDVKIPIRPREAWSDAAIADVDKMPTQKRSAWVRLLQCCLTAVTGKPSTKWLETAEPLLSELNKDVFLETIRRWLDLLDHSPPEAGELPEVLPGNDFTFEDTFPFLGDVPIREENQNILRGLIWCCSLGADVETSKAIGAAALAAYKTLPIHGPRAARVGNACVYALSQLVDCEGLSQLGMLKVKVKNGTALRLIDKSLREAADQLSLPLNDVEETNVPTYGMEQVGLRRESFGEIVSELKVVTGGLVEQRWIKPNGQTQKSVPAVVKRDQKDELKQFGAVAEDIKKMLPVQRERINQMFLKRRRWPLTGWRERYLDHPLVGTIARRIIWQFRSDGSETAGIYLDGHLVAHDDRQITLADDTSVELWHPLDRSMDDVLAWRDWLERHQVQQPFKQAHREIYLLTDAERETATYSNRFAAHVLRQGQLRALARTRGWKAELIGPWDGGDRGISTRTLDAWGIRAEFWVTPAGEDHSDGAGYLYVATDQLRFYNSLDADQQEPMLLADVPPPVFSEVMRDVDLFVGVASVGNDPNWADGGPDGRYRDYWDAYSRGELSASARTRKALLDRLVPRLAIADRCSLTDRFLVVRGDLKTYKIHLGSCNVLMEPGNQYLCIVPGSRKVQFDNVFLPFEGDILLSIILSKALLLADDKSIADPTITSQIRAR